MLEANRELFSGPALLNTTIYSHRGEGELAEALTAVAKAHNTISIGSYPNVSRATEKARREMPCFCPPLKTFAHFLRVTHSNS